MSLDQILVVDDESLMRGFLKEALSKSGYSVDVASDGKEALTLLRKKSYDLVLTDMRMPQVSGQQLLEKIKALCPSTMVVVMTAHGTIESAVEAMQAGAFHYLLKPFTIDALEATLEKAKQHASLVAENNYLREQSQTHTVIAHSPAMKQVLDQAVRVAASHASVLIHGESGTGKEVVAAVIHAHSARAENPYIRVNCAAVPETLIESEFFGHEKGAFTGANQKRLGRFELADGGTLLLDEVTEIPLALQSKLLRVIQEREFERVGGTKSIEVDVRLISTSNRNLNEAIETQVFREDLFYRLNVVPLHLPPLRERKEDILPLAEHFLDKFCQENGKKKKKLSKKAEQSLLEYNWPGNIRELCNMMERVVVLDFGSTVESDHLLLHTLVAR